MKLKDRVVIITGGGTGIGRTTAELFAKERARVIVCGRRFQSLSATVQSIQQGGGEALAVCADVRNWEQVNNTAETMFNKFGAIDILVNCAGVGFARPIIETTQDEWNETIDTNLKGTFLCCKAILPYMIKKTHGIIINVSSTFGISGVGNFGAYCASKFGVIGLTQALAEEVKGKGIEVFVVCPGGTYTDLHVRLAGMEAAKLSMPTEQIAARIVDVATKKILLTSGEVLIVEKKSFYIHREIKNY